MRNLIFAIALATLCASCRAAEPTVTISSGLYTGRVGNIGGFDFGHHAAVVTVLTVVQGHWSGGIWHASSDGGGIENEADPFVSYTQSVGKVSLTAGYSFYNNAPISSTVGDTHALQLGATTPAGAYTLSLYLERDIVNAGAKPDGITLLRSSVSRAFSGTDVTVAALSHGSGCGFEAHALSALRLEVGRTFRLSDRATITPNFAYQVKTTHGYDLVTNRDDMVGGFTVTYQ